MRNKDEGVKYTVRELTGYVKNPPVMKVALSLCWTTDDGDKEFCNLPQCHIKKPLRMLTNID